jgi:spore maturation protein CgeB
MASVLIVGSGQNGTLESSYARAMQGLGWDVRFWTPLAALRQVLPGGPLFRFLTMYVQVEPWIRKANRDLVLRVRALAPDLILAFPNTVLRAGALAQVRASTSASIACIWPDTFVNWDTHQSTCLPLYDLVATYSQSTISALERLGARRVAWVPLAGDPHLHPVVPCTEEERREFGADVTFIGGWRPEREAALSRLEDLNLRIWGPDWGRRCQRNSAARRVWQGRALRGLDFARAVACSKVNLNIIDPTNYPAANMRFFEILTAGGLQVSSACPEMEAEFRHGEHLFYYRGEDELLPLIRSLLAESGTRGRVAEQGRVCVLEKHTYEHRALQILEMVGR